jgi:hypothetical protein
MNRIPVLVLFLISSPIESAFCQDLIEVHIDRRFELMSIVFRTWRYARAARAQARL